MKPVAVDPSRVCLTLECWPQADREAWDRALRPGGPFDDPGQGANWAVATRKRNERVYGRFLSFLRVMNWLEDREGPVERTTAERVAAYIDLLRVQVAPTTVWSYLAGLRDTLKALEPGSDLDWLSATVNLLASQRKPVRPNFADKISIRGLYRAGLQRMDEVDLNNGGDPVERAVAYRDGLMVALQAAIVVRPRNFAALRLGAHLHRNPDGYFLIVPADEVKNRRIIEEPIPQELTPYLTRYLDEHRPTLLQGSSSDRLWISYQGRPLHPCMVSKRVKATTRRLTGITLTIHQFRHCAMTSIATDLPERVRMGAAILNHSRPSTSERYYNRAGQMDASRRHARMIAKRLAQLKNLEAKNSPGR